MKTEDKRFLRVLLIWLLILNVAIFTIIGSKLEKGSVDLGPSVTGHVFNVPINNISIERVFSPLLFFNGLVIVFLGLHYQFRYDRERMRVKKRT